VQRGNVCIAIFCTPPHVGHVLFTRTQDETVLPARLMHLAARSLQPPAPEQTAVFKYLMKWPVGRQPALARTEGAITVIGQANDTLRFMLRSSRKSHLFRPLKLSPTRKYMYMFVYHQEGSKII